MDELTKLAIIKTATEYSETMFPENRMNWRSLRATFVSSFVEECENNYYELRKTVKIPA